MKRIESLDVLRGLTVFLMIVVNNGVGHDQFMTMTHSKWNGLTLCDLVFPFFLFMVGVSAWLSMGKYASATNSTNIRRILKRSAMLFAVGVALHVWDMMLDLRFADIFASLRVWGVLQRIAICYAVVSIILLYVKEPRRLMFLAFLLLGLYGIILYFGNGFAEDETNVLCVVDRALFGEAHLYHKSPIDPEGLVATLSSIAHVLIGAVVGSMVKMHIPMNQKMRFIALLGLLLVMAGLLMSGVFPLNKRVWSPSYVLVTCGIASVVLVVLNAGVVLRLTTFFRTLGLHALSAYIVSEMLSPLVSALGFNKTAYALGCECMSTQLSSLLWALTFSFVVCSSVIMLSSVLNSQKHKNVTEEAKK